VASAARLRVRSLPALPQRDIQSWHYECCVGAEDVEDLSGGLALSRLGSPAHVDGLLHLRDGAVLGLARPLPSEPNAADDLVSFKSLRGGRTNTRARN